MKSKATAREQSQASSLLSRFWLLDVLLPGLSLAGILAGFHLQSPTLMAGGVLTLGLRFIVAGWIAVRDRQILVWNTNYRVFTDAIRQYRGPAAVPMGIAGLLVGYEADTELNLTARYYAERTAPDLGAANIVTAIVVT